MTNYDDEPTKVEKLLSEINNTESLFIAVLLNPVYSFTYSNLCKSCCY